MRRAWLRLSLRAKGLIVVVIPLLALLLSSVMVHLLGVEHHEANRRLEHALDVTDTIDRIHVLMAAGAANRRTYFMTGQNSAAVKMSAVQSEIQGQIEALNRSVRHTPTQAQNLREIVELNRRFCGF